ncbi:malto-oligosyltrehalose trehalohydrolase [Steroidobacter agaridevorans]|uniref:malto-oligosyltrehalose trehalohydrolase n=1 Tax=Steroidobacter agaridevorans TaxID=2695856 RepID=UPI001322A650|nr:malto-oligosyltrehalose trehalohydrolase [Steroidobacter agaridevorans]GFE90880.1 malto-oligosyltrehalose trehalohydrolase [Steroidobacter agaridevorans]
MVRLSPHPELLGAVSTEGVARFRVWAPEAARVGVVFEHAEHEPFALTREDGGYFAGATRTSAQLYKYLVDDAGPWPDPCSRFQPQGVHGPSLLVDPSAFAWTDAKWRGIGIARQVIYELHIGTFTPEGTFDAAATKLEYLRDLGVTVLEIMPVAECPGRWNWGYDGVQIYAPYHVYGDHEAFKRFVDRAHALELAVILDVVYNHLGPDGNYLGCFSPYYFSKRYRTDWGDPFNTDEDHNAGAREFLIGNACYWIREFHLDGFRLDATQSIFDSSKTHLLAELTTRARAVAQPRSIVFIAENEPQCSEHLLPVKAGGFGMDAMWNDDFHHTARVALTGARDGYFHDYTGRAQELLSCVRRGFLYQGQWYEWQKQNRGSPLRDREAAACVIFLQNHDQVGNTASGVRIHSNSAPASYRALAALTLLAPQTPLLFMGQEFGASTTFTFFADHAEKLSQQVHAGRRKFVSQFRAYADARLQALIPDPGAERTFLDSKLDWTECSRHRHLLSMHRDLLRLRARDPVISRQDRVGIDGATLSERSLALRWSDANHGDRLLIVNLGDELGAGSIAEPLLAPPRGCGWQTLWNSEAPEYGGLGAFEPVADHGRGAWRIQTQCAVLLVAAPRITNPEVPA